MNKFIKFSTEQVLNINDDVYQISKHIIDKDDSESEDADLFGIAIYRQEMAEPVLIYDYDSEEERDQWFENVSHQLLGAN